MAKNWVRLRDASGFATNKGGVCTDKGFCARCAYQVLIEEVAIQR